MSLWEVWSSILFEKHFLCRALGFSLCYKSANKTAVYQCCPCKTGPAASAWGFKGCGLMSGPPSLGIYGCSNLSFWKCFASAAEEKPRHISHQNVLPRLLFLRAW